MSNLLGSVDGFSAQEKEARKNLVTGLVAGIAAASGADAALAQNAAQIEVENNQLALPPQALPPMGRPMAPLQPFRIPGRERHEGEEIPLFGGAPDRSRDRARPLVSPREAQQGVEPITTPMNEEVSAYGNAIFSKGASGEDSRKKNPSKAESPVWNGLQNSGNGIKTDGKRYYEWDNTHKDIEVYNKNDKHLGSMDPITGNMYKPAVPGRKLKRR